MESDNAPPAGGADQWFISHLGEQQGLLTSDALRALALSGSVTPASLVWRPGFLEWRPAGDVPGLFAPPRRASYFLRHWRGDLSLPVSYWINGFVGSIAVIAVAVGIGAVARPENSQIGAAIGITAMWTTAAAVTIWQLVGTWRSARKHKSRGGRRFWAGAARFMVVIGWLGLANMLITKAEPSTVEFWRIVMGDPTMGPHELRVLRDGTELEYSGAITFGATDEVRKILDANPRIRVIHLNSRGGRVAEARKLRDFIHDRGLTTYSASGCASACTLAFMGGTRRMIADKAPLGFHRGAFPGLSDRDLASENDADRRWLIDHGVASWFADRAYGTPNSTLWLPTVAELRSANVITGIASPSDFALSGTGVAGLADQEHADQTLLKLPLYAAIRDADPDAYSQIRDATTAAIREGKSQSELVGLARPYLAKLFKNSLPRASDTAIVEATRVMVSEFDQIGAANATDCYNYIYAPRGAPPVIIQKYLTPATQEADLASNTAVIQSAAHGPQTPIPSAAEIKDSMNLVMRGLIAKFGYADVALLSAPDKMSADPGKACALTSALFKEVLALPVPNEVAVLRYLYAQH